MSSRASIKGHPIHVMLIPLPIGLWTFALVADVMAAITDVPDWRTVALYSIGGGVVGALGAAVPGLIDLLSLPAGPSKRIGVWHMAVNLLAVAVFAFNFALRWKASGYTGPLLLTLVGFALISLSGWLGGELVYVHGVAVNAPPRMDTPGPGRRAQ